MEKENGKDKKDCLETPFSRFDCSALILRDELAIERTLLANERTLLAYLRSAVALIIAGFTIMHFTAGESWFWILGIICIPSGVSTGIFGFMRFARMNRMIYRIRNQTNMEVLRKEKIVTKPDPNKKRRPKKAV